MSETSNNKLQDLLNMASKKLGVTSEQLQKRLESNPQELLKSLNINQDSKVEKILNNPDLMNKINSNPQLSQIFKKVMDKNNG